MLGKLLNDITTGKDNQTHEVIRVFATVVIVLTVLISIAGTTMEVVHFAQTGQHDLQSFFQAQVTLLLGIGGFLLSVAGAIKLKANNEPADPVSQTTTTFSQTTQGATP